MIILPHLHDSGLCLQLIRLRFPVCLFKSLRLAFESASKRGNNIPGSSLPIRSFVRINCKSNLYGSEVTHLILGIIKVERVYYRVAYPCPPGLGKVSSFFHSRHCFGAAACFVIWYLTLNVQGLCVALWMGYLIGSNLPRNMSPFESGIGREYNHPVGLISVSVGSEGPLPFHSSIGRLQTEGGGISMILYGSKGRMPPFCAL